MQRLRCNLYGKVFTTDLVELFRKNRQIGYKNICKMMMGEATPEKLKGIE